MEPILNPNAYIEMAETEDRHWWFCARRSITNSLIKSLALKPDAKILEIGCGTGGNLKMLNNHGHVSAMELDDMAYKLANQKCRPFADIKQGKCPDNIPFEKSSFDLICMFDVLEHIKEDQATLNNVHALLKNDGILLITVPAHQWLYGVHDEYLHHHRRYAKKDIKTLVMNASYSIERLSYFNFFLSPLAVLLRLKERIFRSTKAAGGDMPNAYLNSVFKIIYSSEQFWLKHANFLWGISIVGIFKKN